MKMAFSKSFPKNTEGSTYTTWVEVSLSEGEEREEEQRCRETNIALMHECIDDAKEVMLKQGMKMFDSNIVNLATSLFEKRASHEIYFKEDRAKQKFNSRK